MEPEESSTLWDTANLVMASAVERSQGQPNPFTNYNITYIVITFKTVKSVCTHIVHARKAWIPDSGSEGGRNICKVPQQPGSWNTEYKKKNSRQVGFVHNSVILRSVSPKCILPFFAHHPLWCGMCARKWSTWFCRYQRKARWRWGWSLQLRRNTNIFFFFRILILVNLRIHLYLDVSWVL